MMQTVKPIQIHFQGSVKFGTIQTIKVAKIESSNDTVGSLYRAIQLKRWFLGTILSLLYFLSQKIYCKTL